MKEDKEEEEDKEEWKTRKGEGGGREESFHKKYPVTFGENQT